MNHKIKTHGNRMKNDNNENQWNQWWEKEGMSTKFSKIVDKLVTTGEVMVDNKANIISNERSKILLFLSESKVFDYQKISTIDTPSIERIKKDIGDVWSNEAKCLRCNDIIRSKNRHHYVECKCGNLAVDGGSWYTKRCFREPDSYEDKIVLFKELHKNM